MGAKKLRFIFCVELLAFSAAGWLWAQSAVPTPTFPPTGTPTPTFTAAAPNTDTPTVADTPTATPTSTFTENPFATPTWTPTWDPFASFYTDTPTPGSPTATPTITYTFTPTVTGTIPTNTPTMTDTPSISRASLALWPTAYSNDWQRWDGFNWDIAFTYLIGTIAEKDIGQPTNYLNPLRLWLLTSDVKYAWLDEKGDTPAFASGLLLSMLLNGGTPSSSGSAGSNTFTLTGSSMGGVYTVMSKSVSRTSAVHFGYIYGFGQATSNNDWGLGPSMTYSQLIPLTTTSPTLSNVQNSPPNIFYTGFNTRLLGTNMKFEIWKPFPMEYNPVMLDSQIDGLFAFNLGYERWDSGYAVLGYFNFRFTIIPVPPPY